MTDKKARLHFFHSELYFAKKSVMLVYLLVESWAERVFERARICAEEEHCMEHHRKMFREHREHFTCYLLVEGWVGYGATKVGYEGWLRS